MPDALSLTTGKPATCSTSLPGFPAELANDGVSGDTDRYWATDVQGQRDAEPWWQVDLGTATTVGRVAVVCCYGDSRAYEFVVETSLDGRKWDMVADRRGNKEPSTKAGYTCRLKPRSVRHIRVTQTANSANTGRRLVEVMAYPR